MKAKYYVTDDMKTGMIAQAEYRRDLGIGARHVNWKTRPVSASWVIELCDWCEGVGRVRVEAAKDDN